MAPIEKNNCCYLAIIKILINGETIFERYLKVHVKKNIALTVMPRRLNGAFCSLS